MSGKDEIVYPFLWIEADGRLLSTGGLVREEAVAAQADTEKHCNVWIATEPVGAAALLFIPERRSK